MLLLRKRLILLRLHDGIESRESKTVVAKKKERSFFMCATVSLVYQDVWIPGIRTLYGK